MEIKTTDIYFAAALMAIGATLSRTDKSDFRHMRFCIQIPQTLNPEEVQAQWVNCTLMVNAATFRDSLQRLKAVIHSE